MGSLCSICASSEAEAPLSTRTAPDGVAAKALDRVKRTSGTLRRQSGGVSRRKVFSAVGGEARMPRKVAKSPADRAVITHAVRQGTLLGALPAHQLDEMIDFMENGQPRRSHPSWITASRIGDDRLTVTTRL